MSAVHIKEEQVNQSVMEHEVNIKEWSLNSIATESYHFFNLFNQEFFQNKLGTPVISFKFRRHNELGHYVRGRNEIGCLDNINLNRIHLAGTKQDTLETLLHEMVHAWEFRFGKPGKRNYHTITCRQKMAELGIPCNKKGVSLGAKDPFVSFIKKQGIEGQYWELPMGVNSVNKGSKLKKWICGCQPEYGVRVAIKDFEAICLKCNQRFQLSNP